jgi:hypothetical protein
LALLTLIQALQGKPLIKGSDTKENLIWRIKLSKFASIYITVVKRLKP